MPFVSITRLKPRGFRYLPGFVWYTLLSALQVRRAEGFLGGRLLRDADGSYWTVTSWTDQKAMRAYRGDGSHEQVMPRLKHWCDEASVFHRDQDEQTLPDWPECYQLMSTEGRFSPVNFPSDTQTAKQVPEPKILQGIGRQTRVLPLSPRKPR